MSLIKKLIFFEWLRFFIASAFVLFLVLTIANLLSGLLRSNVTAQEVFVNYLLELPSSLSKIFPISCLMASLFAVNKLKNRNELAAIFASGFSRKTFIIAIIQVSAIVGIFQFCISSYVGPFARAHRYLLIEDADSKFRNLRGQGLRASTIGSGKIWYKSPDYYLSFRAFDKVKNIISDVDLYYFDKNYKLEKKISAARMVYSKDNFWTFEYGNIYANLQDNTFPVEEKFNEILVSLDEQPKDLQKIEADITTLFVFELWDYIRNLERAGINTNEYKVLFFEKFSSSLICIIFALVACTGIFMPNRRSSSFGKNIFFIFIFTIFYWLIQSYFIELGQSARLNSFLACFGIPIFFSLYLVYYFYKNRRLHM
jgi:lipopolysaccharide export system permease protein